MSVPDFEWRDPSQAQYKDQLGNPGTQTRFRIKACRENITIWTGWFDDRRDADEFMWTGIHGLLKFNRSLWDLPSPRWHPDLFEDTDILYNFATVTFLTTAGSNQTYTSPSDWNNASNLIELLGAGGSGGGRSSGTGMGGGGGGGEFGKTTNFTFATPGTTTATYQAGSGGTAVSTQSVGVKGGDSWFNGTTQAAATLGAIGGALGPSGPSPVSITGAAGGTGGVGTTHVAGGAGGSTGASASGRAGTGGGGAGSSGGIGGAGGTVNSANAASAGGAGGTGGGGTAGTAGGTAGGAGGNGTNWDATHGSGGGGGGGVNTAGGGAATGGTAGNYGGGGGSAQAASSVTSGAGIQGIVVTTYTPTRYSGYILA